MANNSFNPFKLEPMVKISTCIIFSILFSQKLVAQETLDPSPFANQITAVATQLMEAMVKMDGDEAATYVHPDYFNKIKDKENYIKDWNDSRALFGDYPPKIEYKIISPSILVVKNGTYIGVCGYTEKMTYGTFSTDITGSFVGYSSDQGKTWLFVPVTNDSPPNIAYIEEMKAEGITIPIPTDSKK